MIHLPIDIKLQKIWIVWVCVRVEFLGDVCQQGFDVV